MLDALAIANFPANQALGDRLPHKGYSVTYLA